MKNSFRLQCIVLHDNIPKIYVTTCERHELKDWRSQGKVLKSQGKNQGKDWDFFLQKICGNPVKSSMIQDKEVL